MKLGWSTTTLAKAAGLSRAYIRQLILKEKIEAHKHGRDWVIPYEIGETFVEKRNQRVGLKNTYGNLSKNEAKASA